MQTGCVGDNGPQLGTVTGFVKLDGEPLENASVSFHPGAGRGSFGKTDANGNYELRYTGSQMGATLGNHQVTITSQVWAETSRRLGPGESARSASEAAAGKARSELLPEKYRDREKTVLSAIVVAGANQFDFELQSE